MSGWSGPLSESVVVVCVRVVEADCVVVDLGAASGCVVLG